MSEHTEAPAVIWTTLVHPTTGIQLSVTVRADTLEDAHSQIGAYVTSKLEAGWLAAPGRDGQEALRAHRGNGGKQ